MSAVLKAVFQQLDLLKSKHKNLNLYLGLSGGLDSSVLLHVLAQYSRLHSHVNLTAVYINHNLQLESKDWISFNQSLCARYNIAFQFYDVNVDTDSSLGLEAEARTARYNVFSELINAKDNILLTAHHLNDQAETFLLQLMRASGPKGLSAMPMIKRFSSGFQLRPLLHISRYQLSQYAVEHQLAWISDKTNLDIKYDRNFIRNKIIPQIEERWPTFIDSAAKSAKYCAEHEEVLNSYLDGDLNKCKLASKILDLNLFIHYDIHKQKLLLRRWLHQSSMRDYGTSYSLGDKRLKEIIDNCIYAGSDTNSKVQLGKYIIKKFQNKLYLLTEESFTNLSVPISDSKLEYTMGSVLKIEKLGIKITSKYVGNSCDKFKLNLSKEAKLSIRFRVQGERCRPVGRRGSVSVKKLLQENNIPPWQRHLVPILYVDEEIVSVIGVKNCEPYANKHSGWVIECEYFDQCSL